jgi:hypothetical protein
MPAASTTMALEHRHVGLVTVKGKGKCRGYTKEEDRTIGI